MLPGSLCWSAVFLRCTIVRAFADNFLGRRILEAPVVDPDWPVHILNADSLFLSSSVFVCREAREMDIRDDIRHVGAVRLVSSGSRGSFSSTTERGSGEGGGEDRTERAARFRGGDPRTKGCSGLKKHCTLNSGRTGTEE